MPTPVVCPHCRRSLQLPGQGPGKQVKCPGCGTVFEPTTVPSREAVRARPPGMPAPGLRLSTPVETRGGPVDRAAALARASAPGKWLLIHGVVGMALTAGAMVLLFLHHDGGPQGAHVLLWCGLWSVVNFMLNSLIVYGANEIRTLGSRGLALTACILALVNFPASLLLGGAPVAAWALVVISHPEVAAAFRSLRPEEAASHSD